MKRSLIILGCAGMLAFGLSLSSFAGSAPDADNDGVPNQYDNCDAVANGPLLKVGLCGQNDGDNDGYGNACDADLTNNGIVDIPDLGVVLSNLGSTLTPAVDITCNGIVDIPDLGAVLGKLGQLPGSSGLACAGTVPCIAQ
jgi:hypothetical protein